ncbi:MAG: DUF5662 family protein [Erysipelotrichaceae bacterium]|nr:DUF5662 family protein [Erysipelotrichaceae bacterium]
MERLIGHIKTITKHRHLVIIHCFKCGLYKQGLLHDLSKYSPTEFIPSVRYYQGFQSPIVKEKEIIGYSDCWLHHKGRNRHHWEYWTDRLNEDDHLTCIEMPFNYLLESVCDKIAASKVYGKDKYDDAYPLNYLIHSHEYKTMNQNTARDLRILLEYLKDNGEKKAFAYYKSLYRQYKKGNKIIL